MKKILITPFLFIAIYFLSFPVATAQQSDESLGYRYRMTFEVNDEIGKMIVRVYTNTWVYTENSGVWIGNPHPDIQPTGAFNSVVVPGRCTMLVGRGIYITERSSEIKNDVRQHDGSMTILHPVIMYDFIEKSEVKLEGSQCRKQPD